MLRYLNCRWRYSRKWRITRLRRFRWTLVGRSAGIRHLIRAVYSSTPLRPTRSADNLSSRRPFDHFLIPRFSLMAAVAILSTVTGIIMQTTWSYAEAFESFVDNFLLSQYPSVISSGILAGHALRCPRIDQFSSFNFFRRHILCQKKFDRKEILVFKEIFLLIHFPTN